MSEVVVTESPRLILRHMTADDTENLYGILSDPIAMTFYPKVYTWEETVGWIERILERYHKHGHCFYACVRKDTGQFSGICGHLFQEDFGHGRDEWEIGYLFLRSDWNQGFASEAAQRCRDYWFENNLGERLVSFCDTGNLASRRVAEKNGMILEQMIPREKSKHGGEYCVYAIHRDRWQELRKSGSLPAQSPHY